MSEERYEIRGKIGQGGVGAVYRAYDRNLNREVAIKRVLTEEGFDPNNQEDEATKALLKEAVALCSVQHPHIVTVYDAGVDDDGPFVVMELLSGRTLDEMVERGTMTWPDFRETAVQCLEALIAAQELDLVHRDIKPSNVMVTWLPSGKFQVKLVDFGLAKFSSAPSLQTIDHGDAVFGSIHFMAPEQFERVPLDQRTDMYSLGCVFFFCLAGQYPFDGETAPLVMAAHLQNDFHKLKEYRPDLPDWVCQWVEWHIALSPDERPRDAREALERFLAFEQPVAQTAPAEVQVAPASSLAPAQVDHSGEGAPSRLTGPVPVLPSAQGASTPEVGVAAEVEAPAAPVRPQLITGVTSATPAEEAPVEPVPVVAAAPEVAAAAENPAVPARAKLITGATSAPPAEATAPAEPAAPVEPAAEPVQPSAIETPKPTPAPAAEVETPAAPVRPKLITGAAAATPATDASVEPSVPTEPVQAPLAEPVAKEVKAVVPQTITPPAGSKPSVHTGSQVVRATTGPVPVHAGQFTSPVAPVNAQTAQIPPAPQILQSAPLSAAPTSSATASAPAAAATQLASAKGSKNGVRIAVASVLGVAIIVSGLLLFNVMGTRKEEKVLQDLMSQAADPTTTEIPMTGENVEGFLSSAAQVDFDKDKGAVYQTLYLAQATDGTNIDRRVAEFAATEKLNEQVRTKLFQVVGKRGDETAIPYLLKFAKNSQESDAVVAALDATGKNLSGRNLSDLYPLISSSESADIRGAAERAVKRYLVDQTNNSPAAKNLVKAFEGSLEKGPRESFLRLLGATGAPEAEKAVAKALTAEDDSLKVSAYAALANWRDDSLFDQQISAMEEENKPFLRGHAFDSVISFLKGDADVDNASRKKMWTRLSKDLRDTREKKEFISTLARGSEGWAVALIEPFTKDSDDDTSFLAERALQAIESRK